ncbi:MAG: prefoldin subunit alpha [Sulfolobales archaeon]|nr:prefoldin subunit alpha [Sulfolobales archaeon]MDW8082293.1 prefoldin subunit alpha [Sulfolobales archaeon]
MSSSGEKEVRLVVPLEAVVAELERAKKQIEGIQENIKRALDRLNDLAIARELISTLKLSKVEEMLVPTDKSGTIYVYAKIDREDRLVVHIGQDYFIELSPEKAMEVIVSEENEIKELIKEFEKEFEEASKYLRGLQEVLLSARAQAKTGGRAE